MNKQLVSYKVAKLAFELGFNISCPNAYFVNKNMGMANNIANGIIIKDTYPAPTQSMLQKWIKEELKIFLTITHDDKKYDYHGCTESANIEYGFEIGAEPCRYDEYEEALENGLMAALTAYKEEVERHKRIIKRWEE